LESTGKHIKLNYNTIIKRAKGRHSLSERAYKQEWLLSSEMELILDLLTKSANQGFPFTHCLLKETVDKLVHARLGPNSDFPSEGIGKNWTTCFVEKHSDRI
ncbi:hypothetical protein BDQ17DRAFT_1191166, partial [Cyathus striatus]